MLGLKEKEEAIINGLILYAVFYALFAFIISTKRWNKWRLSCGPGEDSG
jgi:hypothetical protein